MMRGETLSIKTDAETVSMHVIGHSGYAFKGSDIVCAGISVLIQAIIKVLTSHHVLFFAWFEGAFANVKIPVKDLGSVERTIIALTLETAVCGAEMVAKNYPGNVQIRFDN